MKKEKITGWAIWHTCEHCNNFAFVARTKEQCEFALKQMSQLGQFSAKELQDCSIIQVEVKPLES